MYKWDCKAAHPKKVERYWKIPKVIPLPPPTPLKKTNVFGLKIHALLSWVCFSQKIFYKGNLNLKAL